MITPGTAFMYFGGTCRLIQDVFLELCCQIHYVHSLITPFLSLLTAQFM